MNPDEARRAVDFLAASPASKWIGNRFTDGVWMQKCMRCGAEENLEFPTGIKDPADVPPGFDERLFAWKLAFQKAHEGCADGDAAASVVRSSQDAIPDLSTRFKRVLQCEKHGERRWQGHIICDACGHVYQTSSDKQPNHAGDNCRCGRRLMPPQDQRIGDALGLKTGGVVVDEGGVHQMPDPGDWSARPICYLCYRYFTKHHKARVPHWKEHLS